MLRDRRVLVCLLVAVLLAVATALWDPVEHVMAGDFGDSVFWLWGLSWIAPYAIALVAVVSSGVRARGARGWYRARGGPPHR